MKNTKSWDAGYEYAKQMQGREGFDGPVDIEKMLTRSMDMPDADYQAIQATGETPDACEYWEGFNSFFS